MRTLGYFILAYVALGLQLGLGRYLSWHDAKPNLVLIAVVYIALHARREPALLGCFFVGLCQDVLSQQPPGLFALSYGLVGLVVSGTHQAIKRDHPLTHFGLALAGGLMTASLLAAHALLKPPGPGRVVDDAAAVPPLRTDLLPLFVSAGYTAVLAPVLLWVLGRLTRAFAFQGHYRRGWR
jgi:rod shape-determining protein MreD